jgi:hypothetical protein
MFNGYWLPLLIIILLSGCSHIVHDANIHEGINASALYIPRPYGANGSGHGYAQGGLGYGFDLKNNTKKLLIQGQTTILNSDDKLRYLPGLDIYFQTKTSVPYNGIGLMLSMDPQFYFMWGYRNDEAVHSNFAIGWGLIGSVNLLYNLKWHSNGLGIGALVDYRYYYAQFEGDENSSDDNVLGSLLMIGLTFELYDNQAAPENIKR